MTADHLTAVVLAGTHPWSGSSFEKLAPRPLVPVALEPLISYSLRWLLQGGITRATICANGTTRLIEAVLGSGDGLGMGLSYYQDGTPRGPAGCVRDAAERTRSQTLVVTDGTAIPTVDLAELLASHHASGAAMTAVVHRGHSLATPPSPVGVYVFERRALDHVGASGFQDIKENLIPRLHRAGERVVAHASERFCPHVLNAQTYLAVNHWVLRRLAHGDEGVGGILLHPTASVDPGARLVGPVLLGAGVRVEAGATLVGPTSVGAGSVVGPGALVARSVVWSRCVVGEASVVHGCVVGDDAVVPPAARLFNVVCPQTQAQPRPHGRSLWGQRTTPTPPAARAGAAFNGGRSRPAPPPCASA
jgi:NDP-sugar pyrophosphorylase family protein